MRINSKAEVQHATFDGEDAGEGLAIFFSQNAASVSRYRCLVKAITDQGPRQVGQFYISPPGATSPATTPTGPLTRMVASAVCPGATGWIVDVSCADANPADETADIILTSSRCFTSPVGVTRVGERYMYQADSVLGGAVNLNIPPGRTVSSWSAVAAGGTDGSVKMSDSPYTITVPAGFSANSKPNAQFIGIDSIVFTNVVYFIEYLESA